MRRALAASVLSAAMLAPGCQGSEDDALSVVVSLPDQRIIGATRATVIVDYSGTGARMLQEGGGPACAFILPGIDGEFSDDGQGTLRITATGPRATRGPAEIVTCRMKSGDENATAEQIRSKLDVRFEAAEDAAGKAVDLAAAAAPRAGSPGAPEPMSERAVEEAQEAAVKAAASLAPAATPRAADPALAPAPGAVGATGARPGSPGGAGAPTSPVAPGANAAAPARPAAPANIARSPAAIPAGTDGEPTDPGSPTGKDPDPTYDDSPADDNSVPAYSLDFAVQTPGRFGALQLDITHLGNSGGFIGRDDKVDCVSLVEAIVASNYLGERITKIGLISLAGIRTPAVIMRCGFRTRESLSAASFLVEVTDASDTNSDQIDPPPTVAISTISPR